MESELMHVSMSGIKWAQLLSDAISEPSNSEGLLLGSVERRKKRSVTDADANLVKEETEYQVESAITTGVAYSFYNQAGILDEEKLRQVTQTHDGRYAIVGWFKFRRGRKELTKLMNIVTTNLKENCNGDLPLLLTVGHNEIDIRSPLSYQYQVPLSSDTNRGLCLRLINMGDTSDEERYWAPRPTLFPGKKMAICDKFLGAIKKESAENLALLKESGNVLIKKEDELAQRYGETAQTRLDPLKQVWTWGEAKQVPQQKAESQPPSGSRVEASGGKVEAEIKLEEVEVEVQLDRVDEAGDVKLEKAEKAKQASSSIIKLEEEKNGGGEPVHIPVTRTRGRPPKKKPAGAAP